MRIAILGWGSLIWHPRDLPISGDWQPGGPVLPIEFSRISDNGLPAPQSTASRQAGRLTLVIDERHGADVPTRFALSPCLPRCGTRRRQARPILNETVTDLQGREGCSLENIGHGIRRRGLDGRRSPVQGPDQRSVLARRRRALLAGPARPAEGIRARIPPQRSARSDDLGSPGGDRGRADPIILPLHFMSALPRKQTRWRHGRIRFQHPPLEDFVGMADGLFPMKAILDPLVDFNRAQAKPMQDNSVDDLLRMR